MKTTAILLSLLLAINTAFYFKPKISLLAIDDFPVEEYTQKEKKTLSSLGIFEFTAYCSCSKCCGKWAALRPTDENGEPIVYTASGTVATAGRTIATDPTVIPTGTKVVIDGHEYIAEDVGGGIKGNRIDVYFDTHAEAWDFGRQWKEVFIYE